MDKIYDLIIIGAGPAGLSASIYASRYKLDHLILGAEAGGQLVEIKSLENWPGTVSISGADFIRNLTEHVRSFGIEISSESVASLKKGKDDLFEVQTGKNVYQTKSIILAMGAKYRRMNIPGEKELIGRGVSYCATCDAPFFKDKTVAVVGGGNSAAVVAIELADYASHIYLIYRGKLSAEPIWVERIDTNAKIEKVSPNQILEIKGENKVERIILEEVYQDKTFLAVDGVFIEIGSEPGVELAKSLGVKTDDGNYIEVKPDMSTNIPGVFAAGDITTGSNKFRQILTACSEGAIAASSAYKLLKLK